MKKNDFQMPKLEFINITKTFLSGKIIANDNINLKINKGEIHTIIGENGSGKSTLMSILFGLYKQDFGEIKIDGKKVNMFSQGAAKKNNIGMVHQHFHLVENFTVIENIILGQESLNLKNEEILIINKKIENYKKQIFKLINNDEKLLSINKIYYDLKNNLNKKNYEKFLIKEENNFDKISNLILKVKNKINKLNNENKKIKKFSLIKNNLETKLNKLINEKLIPIELEIKNLEQEINLVVSKNKFLEKLILIENKKDDLYNNLKSRKTSKFTILKRKNILERFEYIKNKYGISLNPNKKISTISVGDRQKVEIIKTLWEEKKIIVFDEPTATLSVKEIESLIELILKLKKSGVTIIFISHKIKEVKELSDRISILRKGKLINTIDNNEKATISSIAEQMIGEKIELNYSKNKVKENVLLEVKNLSYITSKGFKSVDNVNFEVKENEIFGIAGIEGNGQEELFNIIAGLKKPTKNTIINWKNQKITNQKIKHKIKYTSHIPIDRFKYGIILNMDLNFNSIITSFNTSKFSKTYFKEKIKLLNNSLVFNWTKEIIDEMNVKGANDQKIPIGNLSGGNQQKFIVGREIKKEHELLLAGHPTRGLDIKAIDNIYKKIINNSIGKATILYSLEINELIAVCNRVAIMYKGKIIDIIKPEEYSLIQISQMMIGEK